MLHPVLPMELTTFMSAMTRYLSRKSPTHWNQNTPLMPANTHTLQTLQKSVLQLLCKHLAVGRFIGDIHSFIISIISLHLHMCHTEA